MASILRILRRLSSSAFVQRENPTPNLFVSGLNENITDDRLTQLVSEYGQPTYVKVVVDNVTGETKGFGLVQFATVDAATKAQAVLHCKYVDGWLIFAEFVGEPGPEPEPEPEPEPKPKPTKLMDHG